MLRNGLKRTISTSDGFGLGNGLQLRRFCLVWESMSGLEWCLDYARKNSIEGIGIGVLETTRV